MESEICTDLCRKWNTAQRIYDLQRICRLHWTFIGTNSHVTLWFCGSITTFWSHATYGRLGTQNWVCHRSCATQSNTTGRAGARAVDLYGKLGQSKKCRPEGHWWLTRPSRVVGDICRRVQVISSLIPTAVVHDPSLSTMTSPNLKDHSSAQHNPSQGVGHFLSDHIEFRSTFADWMSPLKSHFVIVGSNDLSRDPSKMLSLSSLDWTEWQWYKQSVISLIATVANYNGQLM